MPFVADEVVTAAKLNQAVVITGANHIGGTRTFTNTTYLDLDALTGGAGTLNPVAVTVVTGTTAKITVCAVLSNNTIGSITLLAYRISGATTFAADDQRSVRLVAPTVAYKGTHTFSMVHGGLTAGTNVFELQARVTANTGEVVHPTLTVEGIV